VVRSSDSAQPLRSHGIPNLVVRCGHGTGAPGVVKPDRARRVGPLGNRTIASAPGRIFSSKNIIDKSHIGGRRKNTPWHVEGSVGTIGATVEQVPFRQDTVVGAKIQSDLPRCSSTTGPLVDVDVVVSNNNVAAASVGR